MVGTVITRRVISTDSEANEQIVYRYPLSEKEFDTAMLNATTTWLDEQGLAVGAPITILLPPPHAWCSPRAYYHLKSARITRSA